MVEYNKENRFPFYQGDRSVSLFFDNHEDKQELDIIYNCIVERFPCLKAEVFYARIQEIQDMKSDDKVKYLKDACDKLLKGIRNCLSDEEFIHGIYRQYGLGIDKVIGTLYAVYGYYFYTGKRTANVIKKTIDGYKRQPVH